MPKKKESSHAVSILHKRYVRGDPEREASLEKERLNAKVARMVYELRAEAGLSQKELADLVETQQPAIGRLEDAEYGGYSLSMLNRIGTALKRKLVVEMRAEDI